MNKPQNNKLNLDQLTEKQKLDFSEKLPTGYLLHQYLEDMNSFHTQIESLIQDGEVFVQQKQYQAAGTAFTDISDLNSIYTSLTAGDLPRAKVMIDKLDTAARDYLPTSLYDQLNKMT